MREVLKKQFDKYYVSQEFYINKVANGVSADEHTHDFLEIVYVFSGSAVHYINGEAYPIKTGDALFINYGNTHSFTVTENFSYTDIIIKPDFVNENLKGAENAFALLDLDNFKDFKKTVDQNRKTLHFTTAERKQIESLILLAFNEQENDNPGKDLMLHSVFNTLLTFVFRKMALPMKKEITINNELLRYIKQNCSQPISLEKIATDNHYNPTYFSRLFKKRMGCTFTEYLTVCRIDTACELLQSTEFKVGDIADKVGFSDRTKFYKVFAQRTGMTPLQYRKSKNQILF